MCLSVKNNWTGSYIDEEMEVCRLLPAAQLTVAAPSCSITPLQKKKNYKWSAEPSGLYVFKGVENVILALNLSLNHRLLCTKSVLMN